MKVKNCVVCGNEFETKTKRQTCSKECRYELAKKNTDFKEIASKAKQTFQKRYGVDNIMQLEEGKKKFKESMMKNHGVPWARMIPELKELSAKMFRSPEHKAKCKKGMLEKWGVLSPFALEKFRNKAKRKIKERYNVDNTRQKHLKNYSNYNYKFIKENFTTKGVVSYQQIFEFVEYFGFSSKDAAKSALKRLGFNNIEKGLGKHSMAEKRVLKYLQDKYPELTFIENDRSLIKNNNTGKPLELDIVVKKGDSIICGIEYNGIYWHDKNNQIKEVRKSNLCAAQGISLFFIWENFEEIGLIELEEFIKGC